MKHLFIYISCLMILVLAACKPVTTLQKLKSDQRFDELNTVFWSKEFNAKSDLWKEAIRYCKSYPEKINCSSILLVDVVHQGSTQMPTYGASANSIQLPDFK